MSAKSKATGVIACALLILSGCGQQAETPKASATKAEAPAPAAPKPPTVEALEAAVPENPLKEAYFGETHVHTSFSMDAFIGGARITPDEAYRFAKGQDVTVNGIKHNIGRPLDFVAVSDHAEFIGEMYSAQVTGAKGYDNPMLAELRGLKDVEEQRAWFVKYVISNMRGANPGHPPFYAGPETTKSAWNDVIIKAARDHYQPGRFTTLAGFEWTASRNAGNMHRNVLFRDLNVPEVPLSALDTDDEEKLWAWMAEQEKQGRRLLAIPHNSNGSKGYMFNAVDRAGKPLTADYARLRSHFERLIEMMQIKGNSEVHRKFWPADEFANFENADSVATFNDRTFKKENFVRWAVIKGLDYQAKLGANPYHLGFTGGTDNHNGLPSDVAENDYIGSHGPADGTAAGTARRRDRRLDQGEGVESRVDRGGVGDEEHARRDLGRDGGARVVRDLGHAHQGAALRRCRSGCTGRRQGTGRAGLQVRRADGRHPQVTVEGAGVHGLGGEGPERREPRPHPDRQGLGRREGRAARQGLQRRLERRTQAGQGRQVAAGRQHRRHEDGRVHEQHRCARTDGPLDRPGVRSEATGALLRPRAGDSDPPLDDLRRSAQQPAASQGRAGDDPGARVDFADLVHALSCRAR